MGGMVWKWRNTRENKRFMLLIHNTLDSCTEWLC